MSSVHQQIRSIYRKSLYKTAKDLLGYSEIDLSVHGKTLAALESTKKRKLICLPRGSFKSSLCTVSYPIWRMLRNFNIRVLIDSEVYENSKNFIREIRGKLESPEIIHYFGYFVSKQWAEGAITVAQRTKIYKESTFTASGIGAGKTSQHYDLIVLDDLNSEKNSSTPEGCKKVIEHYQRTIGLLEPDGEIVVVGTRYSSSDVIGYILDKEIGSQGLLDLSNIQG